MPNVQHLSYAGITLPLTPSFIEDKWLSIVHDEYSAKFIDLWSFDQPNKLQLPTPNLPKQPKFSLDVLLWPTRASTPAYFHTIVETNRLNHITAMCSPNGDYNRPKPLVFFDGRSGKTITAQMSILGAPRPLNQLGKEFNDLWLLSLTDQRFYWNFARSDYGSPTEAFPTWLELYAAIGTALNVAISVETIPSAYKSPGDGVRPGNRWFGPYQTSPAALLDAVASQVGQRIVVGLDGSVKAVNWQTARAAASTYINTTNGRLISGGLISETAIGKYVPESVQVLFTQYENEVPSTTPYVFERFLTSLTIPEYGSTTGVTNTHMTISSDVIAEIPSFEAPPINLAEITAYAEQATKDWYGWRLVDTDLVYVGIEPWVPTGWEDEIEWTLKLVEQNPALSTSPGDDPYTKTHVRRGPWTDTRNLPIVTTGPFPEYEDDCLNGYLVQYRRYIVVDSVTGTIQTNREFVQSYGIPCGFEAGSQFSGSNDTGSGPKPNTLNLNVVTNVCIDASGGLILQKQNITVLAVGAISSAICTVAKGIADCCPTIIPNPRLVCCPDNTPATSIIFAIDGPVGPNCQQTTGANVALQQNISFLQYIGEIQTGGFFLTFELYCSEGIGWRATGYYTAATKPRKEVYYDIALATDPITGLLFGTIDIPGCGKATIAATQPCGTGTSGSNSGSGDSGSGASGSGPGCDCPHGPDNRTITISAPGIPAINGHAYLTTWNPGTGSWKYLDISTPGTITITSINIDISCNVDIAGVCADGITTWNVTLPCTTGSGVASGSCVSGQVVHGNLS